MPRELTGHKVNPANDQLNITVLDEPGHGGACHLYQISGFHTQSNPSRGIAETYGVPTFPSTLMFQNGPIAEVGVNGITHEALLAVLVDRLEHFQRGPYTCRENAIALTKLQEAQHWLHHRTRLREGRGVEGTHAV